MQPLKDVEATEKPQDKSLNLSMLLAKEAILIQEKTVDFNKNFVCSPLSIAIILYITASGSKGRLLEKMLSLLESESKSVVNSKASELISKVLDGTGQNLSCINGVWFDKAVMLKPSFESIVKSIYKANTKALEFIKKPREAIDEVNLWAKEATKGLIPEILEDRKVWDPPTIVLANAIYFNGNWEVPFEVSETRDHQFFLLDGQTVDVPFMCMTSAYHFYGCFDGFKILRMPYKIDSDKRQLSMHIFLPDENDGIKSLKQRFDSNPEFFSHQFVLKPKTIHKLRVPKFRFNSKLKVSEILKELVSLSISFMDTDMIDVVDTENGPLVPELNEMEINQYAAIKVDENGTEAAAVTVEDDCMGFSMEGPPPTLFIADHPFMFMIKEDNSGIPFFIGVVNNPLAN